MIILCWPFKQESLCPGKHSNFFQHNSFKFQQVFQIIFRFWKNFCVPLKIQILLLKFDLFGKYKHQIEWKWEDLKFYSQAKREVHCSSPSSLGSHCLSASSSSTVTLLDVTMSHLQVPSEPSKQISKTSSGL